MCHSFQCLSSYSFFSGLFLFWYDNNVSVSTHFLSANGSYDLSDDIGLNFVVGATSNNRSVNVSGVASTGQIVFGVLQHFNFENQTPISGESRIFVRKDTFSVESNVTICQLRLRKRSAVVLQKNIIDISI